MNRRDVIIACDFKSARETLDFLALFDRRKPFVKIGMELFYAEGPEMVRTVKRMGHPVFLDLKLHDIPNTVQKAMASLSGLDVDMVNLHAAGGTGMMRAAIAGVTRADGSRPMMIAVTQLTSMDEERMRDELLISAPLDETVRHYAKNAQISGLDGVVCSPLEAGVVKEACGAGFIAVTPGIRFSDSASDDQKRVTTPRRAKELKSDFIVVGRPITAAADPAAVYERCCCEFI